MDKRTEYIEKLSAQMVEWGVQIDRLTDKALSNMPDISNNYANTLAALQIKRDEAAEKLAGISAASDDEWQELKAGTERVWGEVRTIIHDAIIKIV